MLVNHCVLSHFRTTKSVCSRLKNITVIMASQETRKEEKDKYAKECKIWLFMKDQSDMVEKGSNK